MSLILKEFTIPLLDWHDIHGRKDLPWKQPRDAYRIWLSEIMLQQTQVKTVIPYFLRFIKQFPTIAELARSSEDEVLALWSGLGYYSRARHLHETAMKIHTHYHGQFPNDIESLVQLPGIGPSTAAAIASQAFDKPTAILDGNVKRVLSRYFLIAGYSAETTKTLWRLAQHCMSHERPADYTQAIMDLGATCCTSKNPRCLECPLQTTCLAKLNNLTAEYPTKKPKKTLPQKHQQFLLMHTVDNLIYLEKRPAKGIWGGLWCPPSIETDIDPRQHIQNNYNLDIISIQPLMTLKHTFTHFHLYINALAIRVTYQPLAKPPLQGGWFSPKETIKLGLAKPISDMIARF